MTTWRRGASLLAECIARATPNLETFIGRLSSKASRYRGVFHRAPGADVAGAATAGSARGRPARKGNPSYRRNRAIAEDRHRRTTHRAQGSGRGVLPRGAALWVHAGAKHSFRACGLRGAWTGD